MAKWHYYRGGINCSGSNTDVGYAYQLVESAGIIKDFNDWNMVTQESRYNVYFNNNGSSSLSVGDQNADSGLSRPYLDEPIHCHFHSKKK
jgi:hypothetical protein